MARKGLPRLEERFDLSDDAIVVADRPALRSAVFPAFDRLAGAHRALRLWKKSGTPLDEDLRALWLHEQRQVQRLMASSGAPEVIVDVLEFVEDDEEFGVVLEDAGQQLSRFLDRASAGHWTRNLAGVRPRALLWRNLRRIAQAVGLLHANGLVHGRICAEVVMTRGAEEPDFQLSGFEWSLWFAAPTGTPSHPELTTDAPRPGAYSFSADWQAFGALAAELLGAGLPGRAASGPGEGPELSPLEILLLRRLASPLQADRADPVSVLRSMDDILAELGRTGVARTGVFILLVRESSGLGRAVARATDGEIAEDEFREQLSWAATDLAGGATVYVPDRASSHPDRLFLVTDVMTYSLQPFREAGGEPSWDIAYCESAVLREDDSPRGGRGTAHQVAQEIKPVSGHSEAKQLRARLGPAALDWSGFAGTEEADPEARARADVRRALNLIQVVEAFVRSLDAIPVQVADASTERGRSVVSVTAVPGEQDAIARDLGLGTAAAALRRLFEDENREGDGTWRLGPSPSLGERRLDAELTFIGLGRSQGLPAYRFEVEGELHPSPRLFLRSGQDTGTERVIRRRLQNIAALSDQPALADMLADPFVVRRASREAVVVDDEYRDLDEPKQRALQSLTATLPMYLVVGPPGVGKTRLAREVVRRRFAAEAGSRLLLTAQGHDALDNLQDEVIKALAAAQRPDALLVRTPSERRQPSDADVGSKASELLGALARSPLAEGAPPLFRDRLAAIAGPSNDDQATRSSRRRAVRAAAELILDAANVVVSTTNSYSVERLVRERSRFDAVIVEEAAKATGPELVGVLALAGRRLLIGDHKQLPPFGSERMEKMLGDQSLLKKVLGVAEGHVGGVFSGGELTELRRLAEDATALQRLAATALRLLQPFRAYVDDDERRARANPGGRRIAATLTEQRRMHPAVAEIVSNAFYGGALRTAEQRMKEADSERPNIEFAAPLPASPVIVVDFDHVSVTGRAEDMEERPAWHSPREVDAVIEVLRRARPSPDARARPTLAVLSPYRAQVERLSERLSSLGATGQAPWLNAFATARRGLGYVCTTDSFQGSEADLVIVSLVRNNARTGRSGLGFLSDPRRMNVLLSRAKSRLVLVGSRGFLREAVRGVNPDRDGAHALDFLTRALDTLDDLGGRSAPDGSPLAAVVRADALVRQR